MSGQNTLVTVATDAQVKRPAHLYSWQMYRDTAAAGSGTYKGMNMNGVVEIIGGPGSSMITGGGTVNFIPKFSPIGTNIIDGSLFDNGNIGYGTVTPNAVAAFDVVSTTKGMLFPRMTTVQRDAIVVGASTDGLFIYNVTTEKFNFWNQTLGIWESIDTSTGGDVSGSGTTDFIPRWTDGPNSILGDSIIRDNGTVAAVNRAIIAGTMFAIQGADAGAVNFSLQAYNSTPTLMFGVRNDGYISAGLSNGNLTIGFNSGFDTALVVPNTFIGVDIGNSAGANGGNTGVGHKVFEDLTDAQNSCAFGRLALSNITTGGIGLGESNAFGASALMSSTTGYRNNAFGFETLSVNITGINNNAFGWRALRSNTNSDNSAFGHQALLNSDASDECSAFGSGALVSTTTGLQKTAVGANAGFTGTVAHRGVFLGYSAGFFETGNDKLFIDNRPRDDEANGRIESLMYGQFNGDPLLQGLVFNAVLYLKDTAAPFNYWSIVNTGGVITTADTGSPVAPF